MTDDTNWSIHHALGLSSGFHFNAASALQLPHVPSLLSGWRSGSFGVLLSPFEEPLMTFGGQELRAVALGTELPSDDRLEPSSPTVLVTGHENLRTVRHRWQMILDSIERAKQFHIGLLRESAHHHSPSFGYYQNQL